MLERAVEDHLVGRVKAAGGLALKWVSPSLAGVPDRIVILPGGRVFFVEVKRPGGKTRPIQERVIGLIRRLGVDVHVIDTREGVDALFA
mgnify:CR=1 FL=1